MIDTEALDWPNEPTQDIREDEYPISASATKSFKKCPEQFRLKYIEDVPATKGSSEYAALGTVVHETIEEVVSEQPQLTGRPNQLKQVLLGTYREKAPEFSNEREDLFEVGLEGLNVAARYIVQREVREWRGVEQEFTFGLARDDIDHGFKGIMDIATEREIWDWKTGKNVNEQDEIIQGMIYAMGYLEEFGEVPEKIRFVYLRKETERALDPSDENWNTMIDYVRDVVQAKQSNNYVAKPGSPCYWCSYEGHCSHSAVGAGSVSWEKF